MMRQNPGFTAAAVLALALGIGATTAIFSVVNGVILRPLPYPQADRLVQIFETEPSLPTVPVNMSDYLDWKKQAHSFQSLAMYRNGVANMTGTGEPDRVRIMEAESTLLPLLGASPIIGRNFLPEENQPGHEHEAVLSYGFWKGRFGGDRGALGQKLLLDSEPYTVIGVLPPGLRFLRSDLDIWVPLSFDLTQGQNQRGNHGRHVLGRLAPGASVDNANAELKSIQAGLEKQYPRENTGVGTVAFILKDRMLSTIRPALLVLLCAVGCVLLIACANVANLLLARATSRQKEIAVRIAVGAGRGQIVRQLLTESFLMSMLAGAIGILLTYWSVDLVRAVKNSRIPRINEVAVDSNVLLFAAGIAIATALLFGLAPALRMSGLSLTIAP